MCVRVEVVALATLVSLLFFLVACSPAAVTMGSEFQDLSVKTTPINTCSIVIRSLEDHRRDKQSLGTVAFTEVFSVDPLLWVENGFKSFGILTSLDDSESDNQYSVQISLKVAHINSLLSAKTANTVLGLSRDNFNTVNYFRGSHASINWNSSSGEIKKAFDLSLAMAIQSIIEDEMYGCNQG